MEEKLNEMLLKDEKVLWTGRPAPFKLMDLPSRRIILASWMISGGALVISLGLLIPFYIRTQRSFADTAVLVVLLAFLPLMVSLRPILDRRNLLKSTLYAVTNLRAVALIQDDAIYIPLSPKPETAVEAEPGGRGTLYLGAAAGIPPRRLLYTAVMGVRVEGTANPCVPGLLFFHVPDPEAAAKALS